MNPTTQYDKDRLLINTVRKGNINVYYVLFADLYTYDDIC